MCSPAFGIFDLIQDMSRNTPPWGLPRPSPHFFHDGARDVIAREQFGRTARVLVALSVAPAFLFVVSGLISVILRDVVEHESAALAIHQDPALSAHTFGHEDSPHAWRPDHSRRMELNEFHVLERSSSVIGERVSVAGVLPAVARHAEGAADTAGGKHDGFGGEELEPSPLTVIAQRSGDTILILQQRDNRALHVDIDRLIDSVVLESADHLETGAIPDVGEARIFVSAEVALKDSPVGSPIEDSAPGLELPHAIRRFFRVELGHSPVIEVLPSSHRVGEMDLPVVAIVDIRQRRGDPSLRHHRVRLAKQRFADQADRSSRMSRFDRRAQSRAAGADHEHIVLVPLVFRHLEKPHVVPDAH